MKRVLTVKTSGPLFTGARCAPNSGHEKGKLRKLWRSMSESQQNRVREVVGRYIQACKRQEVAIEEMAIARTMIEAAEMVIAGQDAFFDQTPEKYFPFQRYDTYIAPVDN